MIDNDPGERVRDPARVAALRETALLDTPPEETFDRLTRLAVRLVRVPVAFVSLVDEDRDFYKSHCGFGEPLATVRQLEGTTFCHYAIASEGPLVIPDTRKHPLFREVPTVESLGVAAYAGIPIRTTEGYVLGSFCAIDFEPRPWTEEDIETLTELAASAEREIQLRRAARDAQSLAKEANALAEQLRLQAVELEGRTADLEVANDRLRLAVVIAESARTEAHEANRAKSRFLANMSHEIRTPINAIVGYAELLEVGVAGALSAGQQAYVDRLKASGGHLLGLVTEILDLAKVEAGELEVKRAPFALRGSAEAALSMILPQAEAKGVRVMGASSCDPGLQYLGDEDRVRQILVNLLSNAVKFTEAGGSVTVQCRMVERTGTEASTGGPYVAVDVEDTGIGIAPEHLLQVFEPFMQVDDGQMWRRGGTGLGLTISRQLARLMGGDLTVRSQAGEGSCFTLWLLANISTAPDRMTGTRPVPALPVAVVVALGADPKALAELEASVQPAVRLVWTTREEEVEMLARRENAGLVVLDVSGGSGAVWKIAVDLHSDTNLARTPVLLLPSISAAGAEEDVETSELGWITLVPKPFTSEQLVHAVSVATLGGEMRAGAEQGLAGRDVLIIGDDPDLRHIAAAFLQEAKAGVREVEDGGQALVEMHRTPPDVVLLDLMMPNLDGFGVLEAMREDPTLARTPIVVFAAKSLKEVERRLLDRAAVQMLQGRSPRLADVASLILRTTSHPDRASRPPAHGS